MMRAKFKVHSITESAGWSGHKSMFTVKMNPVTSGSKENEAFYAATPGGSIELSVVSAEIGKQFPIGGEVYVDFAPVQADA